MSSLTNKLYLTYFWYENMPKYNDKILNYYNDDTYIGSLDEKDTSIGTGLVGSPSCGDVMKLQVKIDKKANKIVDAKILVFGCGSAKASSSYVAEKLIGLSIDEALKIKNTDIARELGLPQIKLHCSVLAENAIKRAIDDYKMKNGIMVDDADNNTNNKHKRAVINTDRQINNNDFTLDISPEALEFTKQNLAKVGKKVKGIRLEIAEGHCGLMYKVKYVEEKENTDDDLDFVIDDLHIFIKQNEKDILNGTKIDFKEEGLKRGLIFTNPRETGRCHCGQNFFTPEQKKKSKKDGACE